MKTRRVKSVAFLGMVALMMGGCNIKEDPLAVEVLLPQCESDTSHAAAMPINEKRIKKIEEGAKVRIWHTEDGKKFACMITGKAMLEKL